MYVGAEVGSPAWQPVTGSMRMNMNGKRQHVLVRKNTIFLCNENNNLTLKAADGMQKKLFNLFLIEYIAFRFLHIQCLSSWNNMVLIFFTFYD